MPLFKKKIFKSLSHKYRLVFFNDKTYDEIWNIRLSPLNVMSLLGTVSLLATAIMLVILLYTPLREFLPGYPNEEIRKNMYSQLYALDSIKNEIQVKNNYLNALLLVLSEEDSSRVITPSVRDSLVFQKIAFKRSEADSLFRKQIEEEERFNFSADATSAESSLSHLYFFPPISGLLINHFDRNENHLGVDIVTSPNEMVKSVLDGTVILATWTLDTGHIIAIQHTNNFISVYKHNASLMKKQGNLVRAGEAIAIVGNSGEVTTGPHLHFELWDNGVAVNPESYIKF